MKRVSSLSVQTRLITVLMAMVAAFAAISCAASAPEPAFADDSLAAGVAVQSDDEVSGPNSRAGDLWNTFEYNTSGATWLCRQYRSSSEAVIYGFECNLEEQSILLIPDKVVSPETGTCTVRGLVSEDEGLSSSSNVYVENCMLNRRGNKIQAVSIPATVEFIGDSAFAGFESLATVTFEGTSQLKTIECYAFSECRKLTQFSNTGKVTVPSGVTKIEEYAFDECHAMKEIVFPAKSGVSIDSLVFGDGCSSLATITNAPQRLAINSSPSVTKVAFAPGLKTVERLDSPSVKEVVLPAGLQTIGDSAFSGCTKLAKCSIPSSVTVIAGWAFYGCSALTGISSLPSGVKEIGDKAFWGCKNFHAAVNHPGDILNYQYANSGVTSVKLSSSIRVCLEASFAGCKNLKSITGGNSKFKTEGGVLYGPYAGAESYFMMCYPAGKSGGSYTVPRTVGGKLLSSLGAYCFDSCKFTAIHLPVTLRSLSRSAAYNLGMYGNNGASSTFEHMQTKPTVYYVKRSFITTYLFDLYKGPTKAETGPTVKLKFDLKGGKLKKANPTSFTAGTTVKLRTPTKKGYIFGGWYDPTDTVYKTGHVGSIAPYDDQLCGTLTLVAKWLRPAKAVGVYHPNSTVDQGLKKRKTNADAGDADYAVVPAKATKVAKNKVVLSWKGGNCESAEAYAVYGAKAGKHAYKKLGTTKKKTFTAKKLRKGTAYKFVVVGMDDARVWGISPVVFATTSGSSYTMPKKVKVSKSKLSLKVGKTTTLKASVVKAKAKGKMKTFRKVRFTSSDTDVATVNAKTGKVKAVRVGSCTIYAYAQNGVASKVALTVTE